MPSPMAPKWRNSGLETAVPAPPIQRARSDPEFHRFAAVRTTEKDCSDEDDDTEMLAEIKSSTILVGSSNNKSIKTVDDMQEEKNVESEGLRGPFPKTTQKRRPRPCRYINTPKGCKLGDSCPFRHPKKLSVAEVKEETRDIDVGHSEPSNITSRVIVPPNVRSTRFEPVKATVTREERGEETQLKIRNKDVQFFKKRFPNCIHTSSDAQDVITFKYEVTDPDWVFDVRMIQFSIVLRHGHPVDIPSVKMPPGCNEGLPELLVAHIEKSSNEALKERYVVFESQNAYEPIGKILIRWLDRNILSLFVAGLKKTKLVKDAEEAGIRLIVPNTDSAQSHKENSVEMEKEERASEFIPPESSDTDSMLASALARSQLSVDESAAPEEVDDHNTPHPLPTQSVPPIEVALIWRDTSRNIASIASMRLHLCSKCIRCGQEHDTDVPVDDQPVGWRCKRCQLAQSIRLRPELVHENSSVMALLDARGCRPLDCILQQSQLKFVCLACGKEDEVQKFNFGSAHKSWCRGCHTLCEFIVTAVRFRGDFSKIPNEDVVTASKIPKAKKEVKVVGSITEGQPLPQLGTCKHYKKSYRWFRFPCCGRTFPCDTCHEEFFGGEHEMKVANRMICGHCSKEQIYTSGKPCVSCSSSLTRNKSHFWEGGKGCRDQLMMDRNDMHKFMHSQKTISKKKTRSATQKK